ncbi:MAG: chaperone DnaJ domain protein, partial [Acidimicrobiales bacterium]|nr:chaperone DnaJ domain protein [Acidimicrobiales bacterium]
ATAGSRAGGGGPEVWFDERGGGQTVDFSDLFGDLFGGGGVGGGGGFGGGQRRGGWGPTPGADQEAELVLSVEEAVRGGARRVTLAGPDGPRTFEVDIPPGVTDGQRIRLAGQGAAGGAGAQAGDLYLVVRIAPHPRYRVEGRDIHMVLPLAPWEAALGTTVAIDTPGGEAKVNVPPGTSSGKRLRLRGRGLPNPKGTPGDLYAEVRIMVPPELTDEERRLFTELARVSSFDPRSGS